MGGTATQAGGLMGYCNTGSGTDGYCNTGRGTDGTAIQAGGQIGYCTTAKKYGFCQCAGITHYLSHKRSYQSVSNRSLVVHEVSTATVSNRHLKKEKF